MNNLMQMEKIAFILNEPFDLEADLYHTIMDKLNSEKGILVPFSLYNEQACLNLIDDISHIRIRGNLTKVPISQQEDSLQEVLELNNQLYIKIKNNNKEKVNQRELAEFVENFCVNPQNLKESLQNDLAYKLKRGFIKLLSEQEYDLVEERLKLFDIKISNKFDFYVIRYEYLIPNFPIYNIYVLQQVVNNFFTKINNQDLFNPSLDYLFKIIEIKEYLSKHNIWLAK